MNKPEGTVSITRYSNVVTGSGSNFDSEWVGKYLKVSNNKDWYEIEEIVSTTSLKLKINYDGPTASGQHYIIGHDTQWKSTDLLETKDVNKEPRNRGKFSI